MQWQRKTLWYQYKQERVRTICTSYMCLSRVYRSYLLGVLVKMNYKSKFEKLLKYRRRSNQINGKFAVKCLWLVLHVIIEIIVILPLIVLAFEKNYNKENCI